MFYQIMMYQLELIQLVEMTPIKYIIKKKKSKEGFVFGERDALLNYKSCIVPLEQFKNQPMGS